MRETRMYAGPSSSEYAQWTAPAVSAGSAGTMTVMSGMARMIDTSSALWWVEPSWP